MIGLLSTLLLAPAARAQVTATQPNGATNPDRPEFLPIGTQVNQTSLSRLLTLNGVDDFCLFGPPEPGPESLVGNVEPVVVAFCTKPRNGARLIPDGAITAAHFIKTDTYVQIHGFWDGTKVNIPYGDSGGELDPHGAENVGNPIGGNVTSNVPTGSDVFYEEWMSFISYDQFCLRICTAQTANVTTALQCEHELDIMGCQFVMAIPDFYQSNNSFTSCEGEVAPPPGLYPQPDGSTSTFRQRYTGTYTAPDGKTELWTVGQTITPSAPAYYPATSNCITYSTISNGVDPANLMVTAAPQLLVSGSTSSASVASTSMSTTPVSNAPSGSARSSSSGSTSASRSSGSSASGSGASQTAAAAVSSTGAAGRAFAVDSTPVIFAAAFGGIGALVGAAALL
ncbi:putative glycoprotein [Papiliotrema laurentii]|uniref:Glycoprotein n=1 Tax=Papiliotrema laurentii TaxID=5418 RepID=A0AAD9FP87_PAPLA|nr:putative glycoprotein [Papiliotrema laurentii]